MAGDVEEVRGVDGGGLDLNQYLAGTRSGCLEFDELQDVEGVGDSRARSVREALSRLADASIIERYS